MGLNAGTDIEALKLLAVGADEARFERVAARRLELGDDRPVFLGDEFLDVEFAVAHEPQRDRLHAAGRAGARQLAPQHGREREADEVIERAAGEVGVDQRVVDLARVLHRLGHRLLGDGVEHDAFDLLGLERLLLVQRFQHVPGNGFAFAIRVGCQNEGVGAFERMRDVVHPLLRLRVDLPKHLEAVIRIDRTVLGRQVADMPERGQNLVAGAKILVDRLRLGRRLDNDNFHANPMG